MHPRRRTWLTAGLLAVCAAAVGAVPLSAQASGAIRGTVIDQATDRPVADARIVMVGENRETRTAADGTYEFLNVSAGSYTLAALFLGYGRLEQQVTVSAGMAAMADFTLSRAAIALDEVVVTGTAGGAARREIGNAVSSLDVTQLNEVAPISSVQEMLNARSPGLTLYKNSGLSGTGSSVRIRGAGSLNASFQPVYYIDGIRFEAAPVNTGGTDNATVQYSSPLDFIDPDDIERVEVIKGPAAATLYGADAAGGVIQIITKKGTRGANRVQWTASFEYGQSEWVADKPTTYFECTPARIRALSSGVPTNPGCANPSTRTFTGPNGPVTGIPESEIIRFGDSSFVLTDNPLERHPGALRTGDIYDAKLSARGGGDLFNYYLSFNRLDEEGITPNNFQERTGGRANFEFTPTEKINLSLNFGYTRTHFQMPLSDNASNGLLRNAYRGRARGPGAEEWEPGFRGFGPDQTNEFDRQVREERTTIGMTASIAPWPWFENRLTVGLDKYDKRETTFYQIDSTEKWGALEGSGQITQRLPQTHTWTVDYSGSVQARLSQVVTSRFSAGMQLNARQYRRYTTEGIGLVANSVNLIGSAAQTSASEGFEEQTSLGFYLQEQVGWRDVLYTTAAVRIDDNSAFGADFSLVAYPKFSVSYVISDEDFFNVSLFDELKLRVAWGQAGNAPAPFTADRTLESDVVTVDAAAVNALVTSEFGNPDLKPERGQEWELGFDASLFDGALGLEATYYSQRTKDALMSIPDAPSTGFSGEHFINVGEVANRGFELFATASPVRTPTLGWDVTLAFSTNSNELVSFGRNPDGSPTRTEVQFGAFTNSQRHREGYPLGAFWAVDVDRDASGNPIVDGSGDVNVDLTCSWPDTEDPNGYGGSCRERYIGPSQPTREIGFTNTFTLLGNLRIFAHLDYKGGFYQLCAICSINHRVDQNTWEVNNPQGDPVLKEVMLSQQTETHIMKGDFLKLREVALSYSIPSSWGGPFTYSRWTINVSARNLATVTGYDGPGDPEVLWAPRGDSRFNNFEVLDYASFPQPRRLSASITVSF